MIDPNLPAKAAFDEIDDSRGQRATTISSN